MLAMLCILAVFVPTFFMQGAPRELFYPLSLAVGFAMIASYILSSTLVPILCVWLLNQTPNSSHQQPREGFLRNLFHRWTYASVAMRWIVVPLYFVLCASIIWFTFSSIGIDIFPTVDSGEFRLRMRAADGTNIDVTEQLALQVLDSMKETVGADKIALTLGYVGTVPASFPINSVYQFSRGPEEAILRIASFTSRRLRLQVQQSPSQPFRKR